MCGHLLQVIDTADNLCILNAHTHPDILGPRQIVRHSQETCTPLGENLKHMLRCLAHGVKDALNEGKWHLFMEQITHRIHKHQPRTPPLERFFDEVLMERHRKSLLIASIAHCLETLCHPLHITVFTALTDLGTSRDGIPG